MRGKALPCRNWIDVWRNSVEYPLSFIDSVGLLRTSIICGENLERSGCPRLVAGVSVWEWKREEMHTGIPVEEKSSSGYLS